MKIQILRYLSKPTIKEVSLLHSAVTKEMNTKEMNSKIINQIKK